MVTCIIMVAHTDGSRTSYCGMKYEYFSILYLVSDYMDFSAELRIILGLPCKYCLFELIREEIENE